MCPLARYESDPSPWLRKVERDRRTGIQSRVRQRYTITRQLSFRTGLAVNQQNIRIPDIAPRNLLLGPLRDDLCGRPIRPDYDKQIIGHENNQISVSVVALGIVHFNCTNLGGNTNPVNAIDR